MDYTKQEIQQLLSDAVSEIVAPLVARIAELEQTNQPQEEQIPDFSDDVKILQNAGLIK